MDIIRHHSNEILWLKSQFHTLTLHLDNKLVWRGNVLKRLMICVEYRREVTDATNHFFAYDEEYPMRARRGICVVADFKLGGKPATAELVAIPTGNDVLLSGQITVHENR